MSRQGFELHRSSTCGSCSGEKNGLLYVFAMCRYKLDHPQKLERSETETFVLNSLEHKLEPGSVDREKLKELAQPDRVFEDFSDGLADWSSRNGHSIKTYKFQCPEIDRSNDKKLAFTINPQGRRMSLRLNASSKFLDRKSNLGDFSFVKNVRDKRLALKLEKSRDFTSAP